MRTSSQVRRLFWPDSSRPTFTRVIDSGLAASPGPGHPLASRLSRNVRHTIDRTFRRSRVQAYDTKQTKSIRIAALRAHSIYAYNEHLRPPNAAPPVCVPAPRVTSANPHPQPPEHVPNQPKAHEWNPCPGARSRTPSPMRYHAAASGDARRPRCPLTSSPYFERALRRAHPSQKAQPI